MADDRRRFDDFFPDDDDLNRFKPDASDEASGKRLLPDDLQGIGTDAKDLRLGDYDNKRLLDMDETELEALRSHVKGETDRVTVPSENTVEDAARETRAAAAEDIESFRETVSHSEADFERQTIQAELHDTHHPDSTGELSPIPPADVDEKWRQAQARQAHRKPRKRLLSPGCVVLGALIGLLSIALIGGAFFLPPLSDYNPLLSEETDDTLFSADNYAISAEDVTVAVNPNSPGEDFGVTITRLPIGSQALADSSEACLTESDPPANAEMLGDVFILDSTGQSESRIGLSIPLDAEINLTLVDAYAWFGDRWQFIPSQKSVDGQHLVTDLPALPRCIVTLQAVAETPQVAITLGLGQTFQALQGVERVYIRGMQPTAQGNLSGILPSGVSAEDGYSLVPLIANYNAENIIDRDTVVSVLQNPTTRATHVNNIAAFTQAGAYAGIAIDYRGLPAEVRPQLAAFAQALGDNLRAQGRFLVMVVPPATFEDGWQTGAYDWRAIGAFADEVLIRAPLDPTAYGDGTFDAMLQWAVGEVERSKLSLGYSALSVDAPANSPARPIPSATIWQSISEVRFLPAETVPPGTTVRAILADEVGFAFGMPFLRQGQVRTYWINTPAALVANLQRGSAYNVTGNAIFDTFVPGVDADILSAIQNPMLDAMPDAPQIEWRVLDGDGNLLGEQVAALDAPAIYIPNEGEQAIRFEAAFAGNVFAGELQVDASASLPDVAIVEAAPEEAQESEPMPTEAAPESAETSEPISEPTNEPAEEVAQAATPTAEVTMVTGIGAPAEAATATPEAPAVTPTPIPTINAPEVQGTLPADFEMGAHFSGDYENIDTKWNWMRVAGMNWIKIQLRYERGMDANDYGWQVQFNHENGFRILWGIVGEPADLTQPGYYEEYASFVGRLAEIGSDAIEIWNEVNLDREWTPGDVDAADYVELLRVSYEEIKSRNPNTIVISAGLAPTGFFGNQCTPAGCDDNVYYEAMARAGAANYMDCVGAHYNEGIISPTLTSGDPRDTDHPTRYLQSNTDRAWEPFGGQVPVCYTELGYLSGEGYGPVPAGFAWAANTTVAQHASWLASAALISAQSGKVRLMIIWNLDYTVYGDDPLGGYAIIRPDGSCPACDSLGSIR